VAAAAAAAGLGVAGVCPSPLPGPAGNLELFLWLRVDAGPLDEAALQAAVAEGQTLPGAASRRGPGRGGPGDPGGVPRWDGPEGVPR
jgi:hypothetical protein